MIAEAAPTEPRCPHADECGGCSFQDRAYAAQVAAKTSILQRLWEELPPDLIDSNLIANLDVMPSPDPFAYRTRMDYVATKGRFGLRRPGRFNYIVELETCHLIPPTAYNVAYTLWQHAREWGLPDYNIRSHEGFLRYIVVRRSPDDELLLAAVTAADQDGQYAAYMERLAALALAQPGVLGFHWLINDTLTDLSFGEAYQHWGAATLPMHVGTVTLQIGPNSFFQNNVHLLLPLLDAVRDAVTAGDPPPIERVADLYSGVGAITLHLAPFVEHITGVESYPESAELATQNVLNNAVTNATTQAADVLDYLRKQPAESFDCVVVDPPRIGLGPEVCNELCRIAARRIVYVSCNPLTQREDMQALANTYHLEQLRGYDMFPHTPHVETLAVLERHSG